MYKFRVIEDNMLPFAIADTQLRFIRFLHSDGSVTEYPEYFGTKEAAQKVLDRYYPKPKHKWEHGDVFQPQKHGPGIGTMIYFHPTTFNIKPSVFYINKWCFPYSSVNEYLEGAKFLFNIKEKL